MATVVPTAGHRHTRSAAMPPATASSQNPQYPQYPQNPHHLNSRAYAINSESETNQSVQPTTPPRTPRNEAQSSYNTKTNTAAHETGSKQIPRNKRPKNLPSSPAVMRNDRKTPPLTGAPSAGPSYAKPISTPSTAAYAGPTFHASPAPSALPIPSFYSKSVPDSPGMQGIRSLREASISESPIRGPGPMPHVHPEREESPLDFFFKADREEKARARSASSTQAAVPVTGPFPLPTESIRTSRTPPAHGSQNRPRNPNRISSSNIFAMELDSEGSGTSYGPAFSTPYSERINAARTARSNEPSNPGAQQTMTSEALKAYLFSGHQSPSPSSSSTSLPINRAALAMSTTTGSVHQIQSSPGTGPRIARASARSQNTQVFPSDTTLTNNTPRTSGRSSGLRQEVTPTKTPNKTPDRNTNYAHSPTPSRMYENYASLNTNELNSTASPHAQSPVPPSSYAVPPGNKNADIKGMEDSLRKMLKLDSDPGVTRSSISGMPAATASLPH